MGQFEKIVVLLVLFTITVIVVISLSTGGEDADSGPLVGLGAAAPPGGEPRGPLPSSRLPLGTEEVPGTGELAFDLRLAASDAPAAPALPEDGRSSEHRMVDPQVDPLGEDLSETRPATRAAEERGRLLLAAEVADPRAPSLDLPAASILLSTAGLASSPHPDFMVYTVQSGDTLWALATRFYGASARAALLRQVNEGRRELRAGEQILVPIHDLASQVEERAPSTPGALASPAGSHEVQPGENLWAIAKKHYGTGARWGEIFEANQDVLRDPDAVRAGMRLRIP